MNGRKSKQLRRSAERNTLGQQGRSYTKNRRGMIELEPGCTRRVYRMLKSEAR